MSKKYWKDDHLVCPFEGYDKLHEDEETSIRGFIRDQLMYETLERARRREMTYEEFERTRGMSYEERREWLEHGEEMNERRRREQERRFHDIMNRPTI